jgi:hypothetical protein
MKLKLAAALAALPLLAACAPELESTIYVRDIDEAVASGKVVEIPATLRVPQSGADACAASLPKLVENLGALTPVKGSGTCSEDGSDAFAEIETSVAIAPAGAVADPTPLFEILIADGAAAGSHELTFVMNTSLAEVVESVDPDQSSTDFDPAKFTLTISNDGSGPVSLTPAEVFLDDNAAMPADGAITLDRRHDAKIILSDVAADYVAEGKGYRFATLTAQ